MTTHLERARVLLELSYDASEDLRFKPLQACVGRILAHLEEAENQVQNPDPGVYEELINMDEEPEAE